MITIHGNLITIPIRSTVICSDNLGTLPGVWLVLGKHSVNLSKSGLSSLGLPRPGTHKNPWDQLELSIEKISCYQSCTMSCDDNYELVSQAGDGI